jgi:hypothetical protein
MERKEEKEGKGAKPAAVAAPATEAEWLDGLCADPAYVGINVRLEHAKAVRWCLENRRALTRRRFVNWLNRCDKPIGTAQTGAQPKPSLAEPRGWKAFLNHEYPESRFSAGQADEVHEWSKLDRQTQGWLIGEMRKRGEIN